MGRNATETAMFALCVLHALAVPLPKGEHHPRENKHQPHIGERVLLSGTGSRWGGGAFRATVHDVRKDDGKVASEKVSEEQKPSGDDE